MKAWRRAKPLPMMPNRPEYMAIWLGLTGVGVVVSLINTQLRGPALSHCINIVTPKHVIVAAGLAEQLTSPAVQLANQPKLWTHGEGAAGEFDRIDLWVERFSRAPLTASERRVVTIADRALLIYTSGTTGLPKAANVSHRRLLEWSLWFAGLMNTGPEDRMYDCLPMYHSVGGVVATGALLVRGGSVLIRDRFLRNISGTTSSMETARYSSTSVNSRGIFSTRRKIRASVTIG